ncbi:hypothetical protein LCAA2362_1521 [Lacticaseibacillus casei A2-362]|nr:hypothetical protein LCAA2362_1521 [Lacticaseibacillus casei A2-362]
MSEERLYMVKNDEGSYIAVTNGWLVHWHENSGDLFSSYQEASKWATTLGGHVVTLIEEPKKVVVSPEEAKNIDALINAKSYQQVIAFATFIFNHKNSKFVKRILKAITNGYTITLPAVDTKCLVYENIGGNTAGKFVLQARWDHPNHVFWNVSSQLLNGEEYRFTQEEIKRLKLKKYETKAVTDDEQ